MPNTFVPAAIEVNARFQHRCTSCSPVTRKASYSCGRRQRCRRYFRECIVHREIAPFDRNLCRKIRIGSLLFYSADRLWRQADVDANQSQCRWLDRKSGRAAHDDAPVRQIGEANKRPRRHLVILTAPTWQSTGWRRLRHVRVSFVTHT